MFRRSLNILAIFVAMGLNGCAFPDTAAVWPERRPLGKDLPTLEASQEPWLSALPSGSEEEPAGDLTLRQALELVLLRHPELAAFSWEVRAGEARTLQAGSLPNPEVGVEIENVGGSGEFRSFEAAETTITLGQLIELGGKRLRRARVAGLERDLAAWDYEAKRLEVFTETARAFIDVLSVQERLALNTDLRRLAERVLRTVAARVQAGKVSPVEETKARVALSSSAIAVQRAERELEAARGRLVAMWGGSTPMFTRAEGALEHIGALPSATQLARRLSQNPDVARWMTELAQRQAALELEEARRIPNLTAGGGVRRFSDTRDTALVFQLSLPLPLFDRNQGAVLEARYRLAKAAEQQRTAKVHVQRELAATYAELAAAFTEASRLQTEVLPGAQSVFDAADEGYRLGKFGFLEVLDAQRTLFDARSRYVEALAAYHRAVAEMERLIGEPLSAVENLSREP